MTETTRDTGWYWVKTRDNHRTPRAMWVPAEWHHEPGPTQCTDDEDWVWLDANQEELHARIVDIGPRIPTPDELEST